MDTDDYGKVKDIEDYPEVGDTLTAGYADDAYYIDSRTGERVTEDTPEEYLEWHVENMHSVDITQSVHW